MSYLGVAFFYTLVAVDRYVEFLIECYVEGVPATKLVKAQILAVSFLWPLTMIIRIAVFTFRLLSK